MKKVKININIDYEMDDDWYRGDGLSSSQKLKQYKEDFSDLEILVNLLSEIKYGWEVKVAYKEKK